MGKLIHLSDHYLLNKSMVDALKSTEQWTVMSGKNRATVAGPMLSDIDTGKKFS